MLARIERLRRSKLAAEIVRYFLSSGLSASMSMLLPIALHELGGVPEETAVAIGLVAAMVLNFFVLRTFVYPNDGKAGRQMLQFVGMSLVFRSAEYGFFLLLHLTVGLHYTIALLIALVVSFCGKWFIVRTFIFR